MVLSPAEMITLARAGNRQRCASAGNQREARLHTCGPQGPGALRSEPEPHTGGVGHTAKGAWSVILRYVLGAVASDQQQLHGSKSMHLMPVDKTQQGCFFQQR